MTDMRAFTNFHNRYAINQVCTQCDQFGRFFAFWATFHSMWQQSFCPNRPHFRQLLDSGQLWQQLIYPNLLHAWAIFVKVTKSFIFLVKSILSNFYRHLATFTGHTGGRQVKSFFRQLVTLETRINHCLAASQVDKPFMNLVVDFSINFQAIIYSKFESSQSRAPPDARQQRLNLIFSLHFKLVIKMQLFAQIFYFEID